MLYRVINPKGKDYVYIYYKSAFKRAIKIFETYLHVEIYTSNDEGRTWKLLYTKNDIF